MSQKSEDLLTVLDAGSSKIRVLIAELHEGALRYRGHSVVEGGGHAQGPRQSTCSLRAGSFNQAATEAEQMANAVIATVWLGLGGAHVRGVNSQGGISLGNRLREITREDVRAAVERARSVPLPPTGKSFTFYLNNLSLMSSQAFMTLWGMIGNRLEVNLHIATCSASAAAKRRHLCQQGRPGSNRYCLRGHRRGGSYRLGGRARTRRLPHRHRGRFHRAGGLL